MPPLSKRWAVPAVLVVAFGFALGLAGLTPTAALAGVGHSHSYTHNSSACSGHVDPINVIFVEVGFASYVDSHAAHHNGYTNNTGGNQWFKIHSDCTTQDEQAATGYFTRFHMRINNGWDYDSTWHWWSAADAHHEDTVWCGGLGHAVDDNFDEPPGGFVMGRFDIYWNWVNQGHPFRGSQYWGNTLMFGQCNGTVAWSDGWVDFIEVVSEIVL